MRSPLIALCRVLRRLPQFGVFIAFASALFAQAALADGTGKGNGSGNPPPDSKNWTGVWLGAWHCRRLRSRRQSSHRCTDRYREHCEGN